MKILKYLLLALLLVTLYITEPLWRVQSNTNTIEVSQTNNNNLTISGADKLSKVEKKIGKKPTVQYKSRVPKPLREYWNKTYEDPGAVQKEQCSRLKASSQGWETTCHFKVNSILKVHTYIIKNGIVIK